GAMLETSPGPADLLPRLAAAIRDGLGLQWARVRLDLPADGSLPTAGAAGLEPGDAPEAAPIVPLIHAGPVLGRIECGDRPARAPGPAAAAGGGGGRGPGGAPPPGRPLRSRGFVRGGCWGGANAAPAGTGRCSMRTAGCWRTWLARPRRPRTTCT